MNTSKKKDRYFLKTLGKGLEALEYLSEAKAPLTLTEFAKGLKIDTTIATRICYTLTELGFLKRDEMKRYYFTPRMLSLGYSAICDIDWREIAMHYLQELHEKTDENVNLAILENFNVIQIIHLESKKLPIKSFIGQRMPIHCAALGKALMAFGPPKTTRNIVKKLEFNKITPNTITNLDDYSKELDLVKKNGYALSIDEAAIGLSAVAAPLLDKQNFAFASINIAVFTTSYSRIELEEIHAVKLVQTAEQITNAVHKIEANVSMGNSD